MVRFTDALGETQRQKPGIFDFIIPVVAGLASYYSPTAGMAALGIGKGITNVGQYRREREAEEEQIRLREAAEARARGNEVRDIERQERWRKEQEDEDVVRQANLRWVKEHQDPFARKPVEVQQPPERAAGAAEISGMLYGKSSEKPGVSAAPPQAPPMYELPPDPYDQAFAQSMQDPTISNALSGIRNPDRMHQTQMELDIIKSGTRQEITALQKQMEQDRQQVLATNAADQAAVDRLRAADSKLQSVQAGLTDSIGKVVSKRLGEEIQDAHTEKMYHMRQEADKAPDPFKVVGLQGRAAALEAKAAGTPVTIDSVWDGALSALEETKMEGYGRQPARGVIQLEQEIARAANDVLAELGKRTDDERAEFFRNGGTYDAWMSAEQKRADRKRELESNQDALRQAALAKIKSSVIAPGISAYSAWEQYFMAYGAPYGTISQPAAQAAGGVPYATE